MTDFVDCVSNTGSQSRLSTEPGRKLDKRGVLLVGHGTRDPVGTQQFFELGNQLARLMQPLPSAAALLEFQHPTIAEAWETLIDQGVRHIHVAPLLLFAAGHAKQDIPGEIERCQQKSAGITVDQSRPLSRHPAIIELVVKRLTSASDAWRPAPERVAIVMVGRGSRDPCAQADMKVLTEVMRSRVACGTMTTAFYAMAQPALPAVLDNVALRKRFDAVVVYPHLLFQGRLLEAIRHQTHEAAQRHPGIAFVTADPLGPEQGVAEAIRDRIATAHRALTDARCQ